MKHPCLSRRRALGALSLGATGPFALSACGAPEDEGFGDAEAVQATDGAVPLSDLPENATTIVNFGGQRPFVVVVRGEGKDIHAMSAYCTHHGCAVALKGDELDCPCHGSVFDATTGDVLRPPAPEPLPAVTVKIDGDMLRRAG